jgi:hypothetical protein
MDVTGRPLVFGCLLEELCETGGERCTDGEPFSSVAETVEAVRGPVQKCLMPKEIQMDGREEQPLLKALGPAVLELIPEQTLQWRKQRRGG